jgi:peptide/nickel transport system permease protein
MIGAGAPPSPFGARAAVRSVFSNVWVQFVARRLASLAFVFVVLVVGVFFMVKLIPGDAITNSLGPNATPEIVARIKKENGLDKPTLVQLKDYAVNLLHGDLGHSFRSTQPVSELIRQQLPYSAQLAGFALLLVLIFSIPLGMVFGSLTREGRHRKVEVGFTTLTGVLGSLPELFIGTVLVTVVAVNLHWLPAGGAGSFTQLLLPAIAIAIAPIMTLARIVRVETLNVLAQDYIRSARSRWLPSRRIFFRHVLPNVLTAALTIAGLLFAGLVGGAVIAETIFARPGLGTTLVNAIVTKDYPVVQGIVLVLGMLVVVVSAIVDMILSLLDPRSLTRQT